MLGIGMVVVLFGYGLTFYGWQLWECSSPPNLIDVFWPGKYTKCTSSSTTQNTTPNKNPPAASISAAASAASSKISSEDSF